MKKRAAFLSLGCKVNSYETEGLKKLFQNDGFELVPFSEMAEVYVINTCTVTHIADHKSRQMLHKARKKNPDAVIAAVGCYVEYQDNIGSDSSVDVCTGNKNKAEILALVKKELERRERKEEKTVLSGDNQGITDKRERLLLSYKEGKRDFEELPAGGTGEKNRIFLKIQDGCNRFCSYCIIPYARGPVRSRPMDNIVEETKRLIEKGYKEFVLTGIHLSSYGTEMKEGGNGLCKVMKALDGLSGIERIRLGSLEPTFITAENVEIMAEIEHLCPHFHLSLQSGSAAVLKRMNRNYTPQDFMEGVKLLRDAFDSPALTTDIIVGFPGEGEEEFNESFDFAKRAAFASMHIFKYSKREGTPAALFKEQVAEYIKSERSALMIELGEKMGREYREGLLGGVEPVLFEEKVRVGKEEYWCGHSERYQKVFVPILQDLADMSNKIYQVELKSCFMEGIMGNIKNT